MGRTYPNEIQRILYKPGGDVGKYARKVAMEIAAESKRVTEVEMGKHPNDRKRTGQLARGFTVKVIPGTNQFRVANKKAYFDAIEGGARPHKIHARKAQYLQFRGRDGRWRRVKFVFHPGNKPYRLMERSADAVMQRRFGAVRRA